MPPLDVSLEIKASAQHGYVRDAAMMRLLARQDPSLFVRMALRDEKTGARVRQAPVHDEWQQVLTAHDRTVIWSHVEAGKTAQISIGRTLYELGLNPNLRGAIVSKTSKGAARIMRAIAQYIIKSADVHAVFPALKPHPDKSLPWNTEAIVVDRDIIAKDPSVQCCGVFGDILGARIDWLILDDVLDYENTRTARGRRELVEWIRSTLWGRLTDEARVCFVGNAWHPEDAMHVFAAEPRFAGFRFPVVDNAGRLAWPASWSPARIENKRLELGPGEFARQMLCMARDDSSSRFKREWLEICLRRGEGYRLIDQIDALPPGFAVYTGVDLSVQQHSDADLTVFFTILLHPDGTRQVLSIESGRWAGPEILTRLEDTSARFGSICVVENNAAQDFILQFARAQTTATVVPFTTGRQKAHPEFGVEGIAAELAAGRWILPNRGGKCAPEVDAWMSEMLYFNAKEHTGDRLMASWFAREGARAYERRHGSAGAQREAGVGVRTLGDDRGGSTRKAPADALAIVVDEHPPTL